MNPWLVAVFCAGIDYASTQRAFSRGAVEANPILNWSPLPLEAEKAIQAAALGWVLHELDKRDKKAGKIAKIVLIAGYLVVAVSNERQGR